MSHFLWAFHPKMFSATVSLSYCNGSFSVLCFSGWAYVSVRFPKLLRSHFRIPIWWAAWYRICHTLGITISTTLRVLETLCATIPLRVMVFPVRPVTVPLWRANIISLWSLLLLLFLMGLRTRVLLWWRWVLVCRLSFTCRSRWFGRGGFNGGMAHRASFLHIKPLSQTVAMEEMTTVRYHCWCHILEADGTDIIVIP